MAAGRLLPLGIALILSSLTLADAAWGQVRFPRPGAMPQAKPVDFHGSGTIEDLMPGRLLMKSDGDQILLVQLTPNARVQLSGKAAAEFLSTGQWVSFTGEVDKRRGAVVEKLSRLTIFTPTNKKQPGAYPDQGFGTPSGTKFGGEGKDRDAAKAPFGGAAERGAGGFGTDSGFGTGRGTGRKASGNLPGAKTLAANQSFEVRGQITGIKNGRMTLRVPTEYFKPSLKVELADNLDIDLELVGMDSLRWAQKGDKVTVRGQRLGEKAALAVEIEVSLVAPLGAAQAKKKPVAKGERTGRSSRRGESQPATGFDFGKDEEKAPAKKGQQRPAKKEAPEPDEKPAAPAEKETEK